MNLFSRKNVITTIIILLALVCMDVVYAGESKTVVLKIEGMTCWLCPRAVRKAISKVDGVSDVEVSYKKKEATVSYEGDEKLLDEIIRSVGKAGFKAKEKEKIKK